MKPKIFLDLDGVVVDWLGGSLKVCGLSADDSTIRQHLREGNSIDDVLPGGRKQLTEAVNAGGPAFWTNLEFLPWGRRIVALAQQFKDTHDFAFLTSPGKFPLAAQGKVAWLLANYPDESIIICRDKHLCASANAVLIDDSDYQIKPFVCNSGNGYLWPNQYRLLDGYDKVDDHFVVLENRICRTV